MKTKTAILYAILAAILYAMMAPVSKLLQVSVPPVAEAGLLYLGAGIGMLIILAYLNSDIAVSLALCFELFCGGLQNILNVISSVVTVARNERREGRRHP